MTKAITTQETIRRLEILRQKMIEVRDSGALFNIGDWFFPCGTASCVLGHACEIPEFAALGLQRIHKTTQYSTQFYIPEFHGEIGENAGAKFFGLYCDVACYLFMPGSYIVDKNSDVTPDIVIAHIDEVIAELKQEISDAQENQENSAT